MHWNYGDSAPNCNAMTECQKITWVNWALVGVACACNVLSVAAEHYEQYIYYVSRRPEAPIPSIPMEFTEADLFSLAPIVLVLLARKLIPVVALYATILFLIFAVRVYLLLPSSIIGIDDPSLPFDAPFLALFFLGELSGLAIIVLMPVILFQTAMDWIKKHKGAT